MDLGINALIFSDCLVLGPGLTKNTRPLASMDAQLREHESSDQEPTNFPSVDLDRNIVIRARHASLWNTSPIEHKGSPTET